MLGCETADGGQTLDTHVKVTKLNMIPTALAHFQPCWVTE